MLPVWVEGNVKKPYRSRQGFSDSSKRILCHYCKVITFTWVAPVAIIPAAASAGTAWEVVNAVFREDIPIVEWKSRGWSIIIIAIHGGLILTMNTPIHPLPVSCIIFFPGERLVDVIAILSDLFLRDDSPEFGAAEADDYILSARFFGDVADYGGLILLNAVELIGIPALDFDESAFEFAL